MSNEQDDLWAGVHELEETFGRRLVFIGGVAVYLHVTNARLSQNFLEFSHDGDFYISFADFADLRDMEEVTPNQRLQKYQIVVRGIEFDIYQEHNSSLIIGYKSIAAASKMIDGVRVASLEHLLVLKLKAYQARRNSAKGHKDARDLVRLLYLLGVSGFRPTLISPHLTSESEKDILTIPSLPDVMTVCEGNAHTTRKLRDAIDVVAHEIVGDSPKKSRGK